MNYAGTYVGPSPPAWLVELLATVGGRNVYDLPIFRLVHSGFRLEPSGGTWIDWNPTLAFSERREDHNSPYRRTVEVRMALKYPEVKTSPEGPHWWVLEKWHSPETYVTPERWYLPQSSGGTLLWIDEDLRHVASQGDFPYEGAYEHCGYEFPQNAITERVVMTAVARVLQAQNTSKPGTAYGRLLRRVYQAQQAEKALRTKQRQLDMDIINEQDTAFGNRPTMFLRGKKHRRSVNDFAERAGIKSHVVS